MTCEEWTAAARTRPTKPLAFAAATLRGHGRPRDLAVILLAPPANTPLNLLAAPSLILRMPHLTGGIGMFPNILSTSPTSR